MSALLNAAKAALQQMCKVGCPGVDELDEAITEAEKPTPCATSVIKLAEKHIPSYTSKKPGAPMLFAATAEQLEAFADAVRSSEPSPWKEAYWELALALNCLPSNFIDGNDHVLRVAKTLKDIRVERVRQDVQWGGPSHDDQHAPHEWRDFIDHQMTLMAMEQPEAQAPRARFVKIAALAVAAIESIDRKGGAA